MENFIENFSWKLLIHNFIKKFLFIPLSRNFHLKKKFKMLQTLKKNFKPFKNLIKIWREKTLNKKVIAPGHSATFTHLIPPQKSASKHNWQLYNVKNSYFIFSTSATMYVSFAALLSYRSEKRKIFLSRFITRASIKFIENIRTHDIAEMCVEFYCESIENKQNCIDRCATQIKCIKI